MSDEMRMSRAEFEGYINESFDNVLRPPSEPPTAPLTPEQPPADHGSADV